MKYGAYLRQLRTSTSTEYLVIYNGSHWQAVETVREYFPQVNVVTFLA